MVELSVLYFPSRQMTPFRPHRYWGHTRDGLAGNPPNRANERNLTELSRLFAALAELAPTDQIGSWLETSNSAFEGSTPVQVIERGESDRIWRMIWELRGGNSGD